MASAWAHGEPLLRDTIVAIEVEMVERITAADAAMRRSDASVVFIGRLTMAAPGRLVYHAPRRHNWERTDCGRTIYRIVETDIGRRIHIPEIMPCRRDTADRIGRPCEKCRWAE